jgi:hypothetical protein
MTFKKSISIHSIKYFNDFWKKKYYENVNSIRVETNDKYVQLTLRVT